ncbi:NGG1p interacting factor 3 [Serendipita vermifera]|nr:NGG1p interacting factor 3 [Serendipita vermifera]
MATIARRVVAAMERIAPLRLAEKWDNVCVNSPVQRAEANQILLTIDLTTAVCEEALESPTAAIVAYHPPLFRPLSALTLSNPLQRSLLRCAASGVSIFSPHTSLDSVKVGVNDWLVSAFDAVEKSSPIEPKVDEETGTGIGRLVVLKAPLPLSSLYPIIKKHLGVPYIQVARSYKEEVSTIAVCAGSGGSVLKDVQADLYWTGEMPHHEVLAAVAKGTNVILCGHTNTERGYLEQLKERLQQELASDNSKVGLQVKISRNDRDPLETV